MCRNLHLQVVRRSLGFQLEMAARRAADMPIGLLFREAEVTRGESARPVALRPGTQAHR